MPTQILGAAGTVVISAVPCTLVSIFATAATFGTISAYNAAGTASMGGTPDYAFAPTALSDIDKARNINLPMGAGLIVVMGAAGKATVHWSTKRGGYNT